MAGTSVILAGSLFLFHFFVKFLLVPCFHSRQETRFLVGNILYSKFSNKTQQKYFQPPSSLKQSTKTARFTTSPFPIMYTHHVCSPSTTHPFIVPFVDAIRSPDEIGTIEPWTNLPQIHPLTRKEPLHSIPLQPGLHLPTPPHSTDQFMSWMSMALECKQWICLTSMMTVEDILFGWTEMARVEV